MKRTLTVVFLFLSLLYLSGCSGKNANLKNPVNAYYCTSTVKYNAFDGVIKAELQDYHNYEGNLRGFLNQYLSGPNTDGLRSPHPLGGWVLRLEQTDKVIDMTVNTNFVRLTPTDLTLSYACLSMTLFDLTDAETINIYISNSNPELPPHTITRDSLILMDTTNPN